MPTTVSGLTFFEKQFETGFYQGLAQSTNVFNANSGGAITLGGGAQKGLLPKSTFFQALDNLIQDRDPASTGTVTPVKVQNTTQGSVKIFHTAPLIFSSQDWEDSGLSESTGTRLFGLNYGELLAERYLNAGVSALVGAIAAIGATATYDVSATDSFSYGVLNRGAGKMGDNRQSLRTMVGYSQAFTDLSDQAFTSQQVAMQLGSATIYNGSLPTLGMQAVQTDAPPLLVSGSPDTYWTLLLKPGAVKLMPGPSRQVFSFIPGSTTATSENQTWLLSIESSFELKVLGVSYTGAAKPNNAALATSGNWTPVGGSSTVKQGPGIAIKTQ